MSTTASIIRDPSLAPQGEAKIEWVQAHMPVLRAIGERLKAEGIFQGRRIAMSIHLEAKTANLALTLREAGAQVAVTGCNPLSTQDDVAAHLVRDHRISVFAIKGEDHDTYYDHIRAALAHAPTITMDEGADLVGQGAVRHPPSSAYRSRLRQPEARLNPDGHRGSAKTRARRARRLRGAFGPWARRLWSPRPAPGRRYTVCPPSTTMACPTTKAAASEHSQRTAAAIS